MELNCECGNKIEYKAGDIKNAHRLMCGSSEAPKDLARLMDGRIVKLIFTSAPYNLNGGLYENYKDNLKSQEYIDFNLKVIDNVKKYLKGFLFWNLSYNRNSRWQFLEIFYRILKESKLEFLELILWDKLHGMPITSRGLLTREFEQILVMGDSESVKEDLELFFLGKNDRGAFFNKKNQKGISNLWKIGTNKSQQKNLLACFPIKLAEKGILLMTARGDAVLDCFSGSFSTGIACEQTFRVCYGMDLDPKAIEISLARFTKLTNRKITKYEDNL
ncbi:MAG: site-specific DNA-methyltransferase [Candidatus Staskawiczbacteria bacterium]|jgi:DNA modification methylase